MVDHPGAAASVPGREDGAMLNRRDWLQAAAGAWVAPGAGPNVLVLPADQYPAYATGCHGDPFARTPNLDRLARQGPLEVFDNRRDPYQASNLIGRPEHSQTPARLATRLRQLPAATGDRFEPREAYWKEFRLDIGEFSPVRHTSASPPGGRSQYR